MSLSATKETLSKRCDIVNVYGDIYSRCFDVPNMSCRIRTVTDTPTTEPAPGDPRNWTLDGYPATLLPKHRQALYDRGVSPAVAAARGYISAEAVATLIHAGFSRDQASVCRDGGTALLIPLTGVMTSGNALDGERQAVVGYQMRPERPREIAKPGSRDKRAAKYETRSKTGRGDGNHLDVPPPLFHLIKDIDAPLWVTEGPIKGDAFATAALAAGKQACIIALAGVWNWRNIADEWDQVPLRGRVVYIAFDSDSATKPEVHRALSELMAKLTKIGATCKVVNIPAPTGDDADTGKTGIDDYLVAGGSIEDLERGATDSLPELAPVAGGTSGVSVANRAPDSAYVDEAQGLILEKIPPKIIDGVEIHQEPKVLADFAARIVRTTCTFDAEALDENGAPLPPTTAHDIEVIFYDGRTGTLRTRLVTDVEDSDLDSFKFRQANAELKGLTVAPSPGDRYKATNAIRRHRLDESDNVSTWSHTGWIDHETYGAVYLHSKAGIGMNGVVPEVRANVGPMLRHFVLPNPPFSDEKLAESIIASLGAMRVYHERPYGYVVLGGVYASVLPRRPEVSLLLVGTKRSGKSYSAGNIIMGHFGPWGNRQLPASFESTANAVEIVTNAMKNAPCGIDDLAPSTRAKGEVQYEMLNRIVRGSANNAGRARATRELKLRLGLAPRCLPIVTAEQIPVAEAVVQSLLERAVLLEFGAGSLVDEHVDKVQTDIEEHGPRAMAGFLQWLAGWIDRSGGRDPGTLETAKKALEALHDQYRIEMTSRYGCDRRAAENLAEFVLGWKMLEMFVGEFVTNTVDTNLELAERVAEAMAKTGGVENAIKGIASLGRSNHDRIDSSRVDKAFMSAVSSMLKSGAAYLATPDGRPPEDFPMAAGWRVRGNDSELQASGTLIGWVLDHDRFRDPKTGGRVVALQPGATFTALGKFDSLFGALSPRMVWEQCKTAGLLVDVGTVQKGTLQRKLHIKAYGSTNVLCFATWMVGLEDQPEDEMMPGIGAL